MLYDTSPTFGYCINFGICIAKRVKPVKQSRFCRGHQLRISVLVEMEFSSFVLYKQNANTTKDLTGPYRFGS